MNIKQLGIMTVMTVLPLYIQADTINDLQKVYQGKGANSFSATNGKAFWNKEFTHPGTGQMRSCSTCHTSDLKQAGKHTKTGKLIEPMAPSANSERFTDIKKINKWFLRNCKWTLGRECTAQEKGDILAFIKSN